MKVGDHVKVLRGAHTGKKGIVVHTHGSHISGYVMVRLERLANNLPVTGPGQPGGHVHIFISDLELFSESR